MPTSPRWSACWWVMTIRSRSSIRAAAVLVQRPSSATSDVAGVRADVDQRQRVVVDQVAVDPADPERRGDRQAVDHERISASSSSRAALHVLLGDQALEVQAQQRLGVGRRAR